MARTAGRMSGIVPAILLVLLHLAARCLALDLSQLLPSESFKNFIYGNITKTDEVRTYILAEDPLVVYIENFISAEEAAQFVNLAEGHFAPSIMWDDAGRKHVDEAYRQSMTARLDTEDAVVRRVEERARRFPFYRRPGRDADFQQLVVQNYGVAGQYRDHFDWFDDAHAVGGNIDSTFFVYIYANCTGGGTHFPRLSFPTVARGGTGQQQQENQSPVGGKGSGKEPDETWCDLLDCDRPLADGVVFRPIMGNAIYWENLDGKGHGYGKTLHAGLPVTSGNKMGMNMWTWKPHTK